MSKILTIQVCNALGGKSSLSVGDRINDQFVTGLDVHQVNSRRTEMRIITVPSSVYFASQEQAQEPEEEWYDESWENLEESTPFTDEQLEEFLARSSYDTKLRARMKDLAKEWEQLHPNEEEK
jgi:hypothetical protein